MRWHVISTLLAKEARRHLANRAGVALMGLLVALGLILAAFGRGGPATADALAGGVHHCFIDIQEESTCVEHLRANVPERLRGQVLFRRLDRVPTDGAGTIVYAAGTGAIQLRVLGRDGPGRYKVWVWYPRGERHGLAEYEEWFWAETERYFRRQAGESGPVTDNEAGGWMTLHNELRARATGVVPELELERSSLRGPGLDPTAVAATALVLFTLFFICIRLLPGFTCEERERGVLLAQALSPASAPEILAAKALFYPVLAGGLSAVVAGLYEPAALVRPVFWLALIAAALGAFAVGLSLAVLARTQRAASLAGLTYMTAVSMLLIVCQRNGVPVVPWLLLEYHGPRVLHAAISEQFVPAMWANLLAAYLLAAGWLGVAASLFRRRGWQ